MKSYKFKEFDQFFRWSGYQEIRQTGSHHIYGKGSERTEPIPNHIEEPIARRLIKQYNLCTSKQEYKNRKKEVFTMRMISRDDVKGLVIGQKVVYQSKSNVQPDVKYNGVVVGKYDNFITLEVTPESTKSNKWGNSILYRVSVNVTSIGCDNGDKLFV